MNIFYVDENPVTAAISLCNSHVIKMILEGSQILSTIHHKKQTELSKRFWEDEYNFDKQICYPTHQNHPCVKWAEKSLENYNWLWKHTEALATEYTWRYEKYHSYNSLITRLQEPPPFDLKEFTMPMQCVADHCNVPFNPLEAYRKYYKYKETIISMKWTNRQRPYWL